MGGCCSGIWFIAVINRLIVLITLHTSSFSLSLSLALSLEEAGGGGGGGGSSYFFDFSIPSTGQGPFKERENAWFYSPFSQF